MTRSTVRRCGGSSRLELNRRLFPATGRSLDLLRQLARLPQQGLQPPALLDRFARISPMRPRIFVAAGSARSRRAAMHPAAFLPARRRSPAGRARTRLGPATSARQHGVAIAAWTIVRHLFSRAALSAASCGCSPMIVIAGRGESPSAGVIFAWAFGARGLGDIADDRLPAFFHRHVLHRDLLLAAAPVALERLQLVGEGPRAFVERARDAISLGRAVDLGEPLRQRSWSTCERRPSASPASPRADPSAARL